MPRTVSLARAFALISVSIFALAVLLVLAAPAPAQLSPTSQGAPVNPPASGTTPAPTHTTVKPVSGATRVFMTDSASWKRSGGWGLAGSGGSTPPDAGNMKTFEKHCPNIPVTSDRNAAKYVIMLDAQGDNKPHKNHYHVTVYNRAGIAVYSKDTTLLDSSLRDACKAMGGKAR
jgi:hypothetical protein